MKAIHLQRFLGFIFLSLGLWALLLPAQVEQFTFSPNYVVGNATSAVLVGCFGAQAVLCAVLIFTTQFRAQTFLAFGVIGSVPFFVFNYYFVFVVPMFTHWMLLDFVGNLGILISGILGWRMKQREESTAT